MANVYLLHQEEVARPSLIVRNLLEGLPAPAVPVPTTAGVTLAAGDYLEIGLSGAAGDETFTLPSPAFAGDRVAFLIKDIGNYNMIVTDGAAYSMTLSGPEENGRLIVLEYNGTTWVEVV